MPTAIEKCLGAGDSNPSTSSAGSCQTDTIEDVGFSDPTTQRLPEFEVLFVPDDPGDPKNWPAWYRVWVMVTVAFSAWVIVLYSTSYMSSLPGLKKEFGISTMTGTMGMATYLLGLAIGSLIVAPMSELYGRRVVYLLCLCVWAVLVIPCGLARSFTTILAMRFLG